MEHLDELSKLLAASVSRRESLRIIVVVLAGAALSTLGLNTAWAARPDRCTAFCRSCPTKKKRNQCLAACRACNGNTSRLCGSCGNYACTNLSSDPNCGACGNNCGAYGQTCCGGHCADLNNDEANCGACGNACPGGTFCVNGTCGAVQCFGGFVLCDGVCRNIGVDPSHCGGCGIVCGPGEYCSGGYCWSA